MVSGPSSPSTRAPRLPERLTRALGVRPGVDLEARFEPGPFSVLALLDPDGSGRRFLLIDAIEKSTGIRRLVFLRVLPLDLAADPSGCAPPPGRWTAEWADLWAMSRSEAGAIRPAVDVQSARGRPPVLPPVFFCPKKAAFIEAVCEGCAGAPQEDGPAPDRLCAACGSPTGGSRTGEAPSREPLKILWNRVRRGAESSASGAPQTGGSADPFCTMCDRRGTCYPASGPSADPETAGAILVPLADRPWGGIFVEPFHLPAGAWFRLIGGTAWAAVRRELKELPAAILEEVETRFHEERRFLYGPEYGQAFGLESFLLKLEVLRQLLTTLSRLSLERGHPHLGVTSETLWVRLDPSDCLRSALWSARVQLIDLAPGFSEGAVGGGAERFLPPPGRPPIFSPPGCAVGTEWVEGLCILKGSTAPGGASGMVRVEFLPAVHFSKPPVKGDLVRLGLRAQGAGGPARSILGRVETALPEMCRILIQDPSLPDDEIRALLTHGHGGSNIRLSIVRDHSLVDDLFAAGTMWIASMMSNPGDFPAAARFRDDLSPRLKGTRPGGGDTAVRESLKAAETSRLFAIHAMRDPIESASRARPGPAFIDPDMMARSLALGMRLCGAVPAGYPGQDHEPAGLEERGRAYDTLLSMVVEMGRQAREGMLGSAPAAGGGEDEILGALGAYARERSARARGKPLPPLGPGLRRPTGDG